MCSSINIDCTSISSTCSLTVVVDPILPPVELLNLKRSSLRLLAIGFAFIDVVLNKIIKWKKATDKSDYMPEYAKKPKSSAVYGLVSFLGVSPSKIAVFDWFDLLLFVK